MSLMTTTYHVDYIFFDSDTGCCNSSADVEATSKINAYEVFMKDFAPPSLMDIESIKSEEELEEENASPIVIPDNERNALDKATENYIDDRREFIRTVYCGSNMVKDVIKEIDATNDFRARIMLTRV